MKSKNFETVLYSTIGIVVMLGIVVAVNFMAGLPRVRVDLTEEKLYTLSDGTKSILGRLDGKLKIRFYCTQDDPAMPIPWANYAKRIEDLLAEYKKAAGGKIEIEKLNPQPDTDAEDFANLDNVTPRQIGLTESVYLGLSFTYIDAKTAIAFMPAEREKFLEYDITRAISQVINPERPVIGLMSGLPIFGQPMNPMMMQMGQRGQQPWQFVSELQKDFTVKRVELETDKIDDDIKVLVVHHPKNISEKTQFALDQFVLRGGRLIAFLDPYAWTEGRPNPAMGGGQQGGSTLDKLLPAWGLNFDSGKVLADRRLRNQGVPPQFQLFVPTLSQEYIKQDEIICGQLDNIMLGWAGAFTGTPAEGLKMDVLMQSSPESGLLDRFMVEMAGEQAGKDLKTGDKQLMLALRLSGTFKTAFPNGKPKDAAPAEDKKDEPKDEKKPDAKEDALKTGKSPTSVILVADADLLHEQFYANVQQIAPGQNIMMMFSGNLTFLQNALELLTGDNSLINSRSRATKSRNFTVIREIRAQAARELQGQIESFEKEKQEIQQKLSELQTKKDSNQRFVLSPEQKAELEKYRKSQVETNRRIKDLSKALRRKEEALETKLKVMNLAAMPLLVSLFGIGLAVVNRKRTAAK
jgi:ABC-type uncharacterized transport system involved in gliding motility auxiliary subunit